MAEFTAFFLSLTLRKPEQNPRLLLPAFITIRRKLIFYKPHLSESVYLSAISLLIIYGLTIPFPHDARTNLLDYEHKLNQQTWRYSRLCV